MKTSERKCVFLFFLSKSDNSFTPAIWKVFLQEINLISGQNCNWWVHRKERQTKVNYETKVIPAVNQTKPIKPNRDYQIKPTRLNLPTQTFQTKPTKPNLPNQTYQTKPTKPNLPNQTQITKPTKPKLLVKAVNAWVRSAFGNVWLFICDYIIFISFIWLFVTF